MLKVVWDEFKKNYAALITIATTFVTVIYAIIKFVIYTYWSGYFRRFDIDRTFMKLDYNGIIYQSIFVFVLVLAVIYVMCTLETIYENNWIELKKKQSKKVFEFIKMVVLDLCITAVLLMAVNCPCVICICAWGNMECTMIVVEDVYIVD